MNFNKVIKIAASRLSGPGKQKILGGRLIADVFLSDRMQPPLFVKRVCQTLAKPIIRTLPNLDLKVNSF